MQLCCKTELHGKTMEPNRKPLLTYRLLHKNSMYNKESQVYNKGKTFVIPGQGGGCEFKPRPVHGLSQLGCWDTEPVGTRSPSGKSDRHAREEKTFQHFCSLTWINRRDNLKYYIKQKKNWKEKRRGYCSSLRGKGYYLIN